MFTRTHRTRMLAAAALAAATLTLTACNNGEGVNDEGASAGSSATATDPTTATPEASASKGSTGGSAGSNNGATPSASTGSSGTSGSSGSSGSTGGSADSASDSSTVACAKTSTRTTATPVSRPLNHLLLTVTNTGSKNCTLIDYPAVRFGEGQTVPPVFEDSMPQAVVTLAPGESGYASVLLSAADGSGSNGYTTKSLEVYFNSAAKTAARPSLPAKGVYIDSSIQVSYWQSTMADALAW